MSAHPHRGEPLPSDVAPRPAPGPAAAAAADGYALLGIGRPGPRIARRLPAGVVAVRHRALEALLQPAPFGPCAPDRAAVLKHQRALEQAMRRGPVLPAPCGVVFRGRAAVLRFLEEQYAPLDAALDFLAGRVELRVHVLPHADRPAGELRAAGARLYHALRRRARAAIPCPCGERRVLSAAFLVERAEWVAFVEHAHDLAAEHPELAVDVTGPWPPYDFVRWSAG